MDEKTKTIEQSENRTTETTNNDVAKIIPFHRNCIVCSSGIVDEIHKLRPQNTLRQLSEIIKNEFNLDITKDALHNHFRRYASDLNFAVSREMYERFEQEVDEVADHKRKTLFLAQVSFDHIMDRLESGTLVFGIEEFEKLIKLYHSVLKNPENAGDQNILAIFQRASEKFGCTLEQGVLVKMPKKTEAV